MKVFEGVLHPRTAQEAKGHGIKVPPFVRIRGCDGIKYFPKDIAQQPAHANDRNVGYDLVDIFRGGGLWARRNNRTTFHSFGRFRGDNGVDNSARAPWAWDDRDDGSSLQGGELALHPAKLVQKYFNGLGNFDLTYTYNAYRSASSAPAPAISRPTLMASRKCSVPLVEATQMMAVVAMTRRAGRVIRHRVQDWRCVTTCVMLYTCPLILPSTPSFWHTL